MQATRHEIPTDGAPIALLHYGERGVPLLWIPTSGGDETEFERYDLPRALAPWIESGRIQVLSIDGHGPRTLFDDGLRPAERMRHYAAFERRLVTRGLPWIERRTGEAQVEVVGASYGAFVAANLLLKHAARVRVACGLGGVYGMWHRLDGHHDDDVYFHTPLEYLPRLADARILAAIRGTEGLVLYAAAADPWLDSSHRMAGVLGQQGLPHAVEIWPAPADHHPRWWRAQLVRFVERRYGAAPAR